MKIKNIFVGLQVASMDWLDENTLWLDLHELGYPVKQSWVIRFEGNKAKIEHAFRGASAGKMELFAQH